jgi:hypothetical protein
MDETLFIESIFNYCNSRCELCAFQERCRVFHDMGAYRRQHPDRGPVQQSHDKFQEVFRMLEEWCGREGLDFEELKREAHSEEAEAGMKRVDDAVRDDPLQRLATAYAVAAFKLVDALSTARRLRSWPRNVTEAIDTIAWNAGLIGAKVHRALHGFATRHDVSDEDIVQNDWNGSAKVARLIVTESRDAWRVVMEAGNAAASSPLTELVKLLGRIDDGLAERFPRAMEFLRPGFDQPDRAGMLTE